MNPFSRKDWKRAARKAQDGEGGPGWAIGGFIFIVVIIITLIDMFFNY